MTRRTLLLVAPFVVLASCGNEATAPSDARPDDLPVVQDSRDPSVDDPVIGSEPRVEAVVSAPGASLDRDVSGGLVPGALVPVGALISTDAVRWDDLIVTGTAAGELVAYDLDSGGERWRVDAGAMPVQLAVTPASLYVATRDELSRRDPATGATEWTLELAAPATTPLTLTRSALYLGSADGALLAVDTARGTLRGRVELGGTPVGRMPVSDGVVYLHTEEGALVAVDVVDFGERWRRQVAAAFVAGPAYAEGAVASVAVDGTVVVHDVTGGVAEGWSLDGAPLLVSGVWYADGLVTVDGEGTIVAHGPDGDVRWRAALTAHLAGVPVRLGDVLVAGEAGGGAVALDLRTGDEISRIALGAAPRGTASVLDDELFLVLADGSVAVLGVNGDFREAPLFSAEGSWVLPENGTFRLRDDQVALSMRSDRDAVFEITVRSAPVEQLVLRVVTEGGATIATNMGKVTLGRSVRAALDAGVRYELVVSRPEAGGEVTISVGTEQLQ